MGTGIRASHRRSRTSDYSFSAKWRMSDRTELSTDLQFIKPPRARWIRPWPWA